MKTLFTLTLIIAFCSSASFAQVRSQPRAGAAGSWRIIGTVHANLMADHDAILVEGPFDNLRRIKFKVTDAPLNLHRLVVTYDNGAPDKIDVRQDIPRGAPGW